LNLEEKNSSTFKDFQGYVGILITVRALTFCCILIAAHHITHGNIPQAHNLLNFLITFL